MRAGGEGKKSWTPDLTALLQDLKRPLPMLLRLGVFEVSGVSSSANVCVHTVITNGFSGDQIGHGVMNRSSFDTSLRSSC